MKLLLCCEAYYPSRGGVQEVMQQVAERLVGRGHDVTVATSAHPNRVDDILNGVKIQSFSVRGNRVKGLIGDIDSYRRFVRSFNGDAVMIKAAQQWSFDALWDDLPGLAVPVAFVPCGFTGRNQPAFKAYYEQLRPLLEYIDHFIFYGRDCSDALLVPSWDLKPDTVIPNGADEREFSGPAVNDARAKLGIAHDQFLILTVGSFSGLKGQEYVVDAIRALNLDTRKISLVVNGNRPKMSGRSGWRELASQWKYILKMALPLRLKSIAIRLQGKQIKFTDLERDDLVSLYKAADLFVFASKTEYSPLVLYECAASGTPFITVDVGNATEIARNTGSGVIVPTVKDGNGLALPDVKALCKAICKLSQDPDKMSQMSRDGVAAWADRYQWQTIALQYEDVLARVVKRRDASH